jgi:ankyrin repeat protein
MLSAVLTGDTAEVVDLLDADPQLADLADRSPDRLSVLYHAASRGYLSIVEMLLAAGATVDKRAHDGSTPLHAAAFGGHMEIVWLLVATGADPNARVNSGYAPWHAADTRGHRAVADLLRGLLTKGQ